VSIFAAIAHTGLMSFKDHNPKIKERQNNISLCLDLNHGPPKDEAVMHKPSLPGCLGIKQNYFRLSQLQ
jgi:hypothetical protein